MASSGKGGLVLAIFALLVASLAFVLVVIVWARPDIVTSAEPEANGNDKPSNNGGITTTLKPENSKESDGDSNDDDVDDDADDDDDDDNYDEEPPEPKPEKTYLFALPRAEEYPNILAMYDEMTGWYQGLAYDLVRAVCERAGKKCDFYIFKDITDDACWDVEVKYSKGLLFDWFDVCIAWFDSINSSDVHGFFGHFMYYELLWGLWATSNSTVTSGVTTVGFNHHYYADQDCLKKETGIVPGEVRFYQTNAEMLQGLQQGEIEAIFTLEYFGIASNLTKVSATADCPYNGVAMMTRKDKVPNMQWYQDAFDEMVQDGTFKDLCRKGELMYDGPSMCMFMDA